MVYSGDTYVSLIARPSHALGGHTIGGVMHSDTDFRYTSVH